MTGADISPLARVIRRVDAAADGAPPPDSFPTGFPSLDTVLGGGLRRGDLIVLGGDTGAGKSALALAVALRVARTGHRVAVLSGEMTPERIVERCLAIEGRARIDDLRRGALDDEARSALGVAALRLRNELPAIERIGGGVSELAHALRGTPHADVAIVDSLQALPTGAARQEEELAHAVRELKRLALEAELALLLTAHLPDFSAGRSDLRPTLDDFDALGAVRQHADVVLAIFREAMYSSHQVAEGASELAVLKNRNGATGYVDLYFYKQWLRFEDVVEEQRARSKL